MRYSDIILTNGNIEEATDKLIRILTPESNITFDRFSKQLDSSFRCLTNDDGSEEWIKSSISGDMERGKLAYEFGNGFLVFDFEELI